MDWISDPFGFCCGKKIRVWKKNAIQKCCLWEFPKDFLWIDVLIKWEICIFHEHPKASIRCLSPVPSSQKRFEYVERTPSQSYYFIWHSWKKRLRYYSIFSQKINVSVVVTDSISINVVHCRVDCEIIEMLTCLSSIFNSILQSWSEHIFFSMENVRLQGNFSETIHKLKWIILVGAI